MTPPAAQPPPAARTPAGRLDESGLRSIVGYQLAQATIVTTRSFKQHIGDVFDLRPVEFTILALVDANPGVSARKLADALAVTPPNITMWIDKLERRGWIERERSAEDGRAQHIRATTAGAKVIREAIAAAVAGEREMLAPLSEAERAMLLELLHKTALCRRK